MKKTTEEKMSRLRQQMAELEPGNHSPNDHVRMAHEKERTALLADTAHAMQDTKDGFRLVVERRQEEEADTEELDGLLVHVPRIVTRHWAIATNDHTAPRADVVVLYNRRQGCDEQGNDKFKNDVLLGALPCRLPVGRQAARMASPQTARTATCAPCCTTWLSGTSTTASGRRTCRCACPPSCSATSPSPRA